MTTETFKSQRKFQNGFKMEYTKYEESKIIGSRALQLAQGAPFMIKLSDKDLERISYNPVEIAKMEFKEGVIPITTRRLNKESKEA